MGKSQQLQQSASSKLQSPHKSPLRPPPHTQHHVASSSSSHAKAPRGSRILTQLTSYLLSPVSSIRDIFSSADSVAASAKPAAAASSQRTHSSNSSSSSEASAAAAAVGHMSRKRPRSDDEEGEEESKSNASAVSATRRRVQLTSHLGNSASAVKSRSSGNGSSTTSSPAGRPQAATSSYPPTRLSLKPATAGASTAAAPAAPVGFNGNQWIDRFGVPKVRASGSSANGDGALRAPSASSSKKPSHKKKLHRSRHKRKSQARVRMHVAQTRTRSWVAHSNGVARDCVAYCFCLLVTRLPLPPRSVLLRALMRQRRRLPHFLLLPPLLPPSPRPSQ